MQPFAISLDTGERSLELLVEPTDNNGLMQYVIREQDETGQLFPEGNFAVLEIDADEWRQSPESIERGPTLPCFLVEEIGEAIANFTKSE